MQIDFDNKILQGLSSAFDALIITFMWMLLSLPIITAGAATTAAFSVLLNIDKMTSSVIVRFLKAMRANFKISTAVWVIFLVLGAILAIDFYICWGKAPESQFLPFFQTTTLIACLFYSTTLGLVFGIIAKFDVTLKQVFYNAFVMILRCPIWSILNAIMILASVFCYASLLALGFLPDSILWHIRKKLLIKTFQPFLRDAEEKLN